MNIKAENILNYIERKYVSVEIKEKWDMFDDYTDYLISEINSNDSTKFELLEFAITKSNLFLKNKLEELGSIEKVIKWLEEDNLKNPPKITYTKGDFIPQNGKIGDIIYEFGYGMGVKCEIIDKKPEWDGTGWHWKCCNVYDKKDIINYYVSHKNSHYGPNVYTTEAYIVQNWRGL